MPQHKMETIHQQKESEGQVGFCNKVIRLITIALQLSRELCVFICNQSKKRILNEKNGICKQVADGVVVHSPDLDAGSVASVPTQ